MIDLAAIVLAALIGANPAEDDECRDLTPKASSRAASASTARAHASPASRPASGPIRRTRRLPTEDRCNEAVTSVAVPTFRTVERIDLDSATWEEQGGALETLEGLRIEPLTFEDEAPTGYSGFGWSSLGPGAAPILVTTAPPVSPVPELGALSSIVLAFAALYLRRST